MSAVNFTYNPTEKAKSFVLSAYDKGRRQRECWKSVQRILTLAQSRGFKNMEAFNEYFLNTDKPSNHVTERQLQMLFEYVSPDEIAHFADH